MRVSTRLLPPLAAIIAALAPAAAMGQGVTAAPPDEPVYQLDDIVVSASRVPLEASRVGSSVTVFTAEDIRSRGLQTVADVLRETPGVAVSQSGGSGSITQVRIRGAEANQTLVMIDGVQSNQVGDGDFDYADFLVDDIERVEVIRGPQSGLYGSNANAGLVNIVTKSGRGLAKPVFESRVEGGSMGTTRATVGARGAVGGFYGSVMGQGFRTDGDNISRFGEEKDGSSTGILTAKAGVDIGDVWNIEGMLRHVERAARTDPQDFADPPTHTYGFVVDGDDSNRFRSTTGRIASTLSLFDGRLTSRTAGSFFDQTYSFDADGKRQYTADGTRNRFEQYFTGKADTSLFGGERHALTAGVDYQKETFRYRSLDLAFDPDADEFWRRGADRTRTGLSGEYVVETEHGTAASAAIRHDWNSDFKDATTWRLTGSQKFHTGTRLHGSVGTGITDPTFFEQFGFFSNFVGNPNLRPEQSLGWDAGIEQTLWDGRVVVDATYFHTTLEDEIVQVFGTPSTVENLKGASRRQGVELSGTFKPVDWLDLVATYTYTQSEDATGITEIRRPPHTASLSAVARFDEGRGRASANVVYNGTTKDIRLLPTTPFSTVVDLPAYTLISAELAYTLRPGLTGYVRAENVLDVRYENVFSYQAPGFGAYAGLRAVIE